MNIGGVMPALTVIVFDSISQFVTSELPAG